MTAMLTCMITLLGYMIYLIFPCESQTITVNPSGEWTEDTSVTLTCNISSWLGEMKWKLGSKDVARCTPITCSTIDTGEGAFLFGFDTVNYIFTWTLDPVKITNNGNVFNCYDGAKTINFTATVHNKMKTTTAATVTYGTGIASIVLAPVAAAVGLIALILAIVLRINQNQTTLTQNKGHVTEMKLPKEAEERLKSLETEVKTLREKVRKWTKNNRAEEQNTNANKLDNVASRPPLPAIK